MAQVDQDVPFELYRVFCANTDFTPRVYAADQDVPFEL